MAGSGDAGYLEFTAALDVGTTNIRCEILDSSATTIGKAIQKVKLLHPQPGWVEINPDDLFNSIIDVIKASVKNANVPFDCIKFLGISTHRATFITWEKDSGQYLHNLITWQDLRAEHLLKGLNSSFSFSVLKGTAYILYLLTRIDKLGVASKLKITSSHVTGRLLWVLNNITEVKECLNKKNLMFGTLDTWLIYKLTGEKTYVTDIASASATGLYDSFDLNWSIVAKFLGIPIHIFPKVVNNDYNFGSTDKSIFVKPLKISCVMPDQSASLFGTCCFNKNEVKLTMGTGAYLDVNTGQKLYPCVTNMYPLIGWQTKDQFVYMLEVPCLDTGSIIEQLQTVGIIKDPAATSDMALKVQDCDGMFFVPEFTNSEHSTGGDITSRFVEIKETTTTEHKIRAVLESIAYRIFMCYNILKSETKETYHSLRVDGGVSKNNFVCQLVADLTNLPVLRMTTSDLSIMGVTYMTGLTAGTWRNRKTISSINKMDRNFTPNSSSEYRQKLINDFTKWVEVVEIYENAQVKK